MTALHNLISINSYVEIITKEAWDNVVPLLYMSGVNVNHTPAELTEEERSKFIKALDFGGYPDHTEGKPLVAHGFRKISEILQDYILPHSVGVTAKLTDRNYTYRFSYPGVKGSYSTATFVPFMNALSKQLIDMINELKLGAFAGFELLPIAEDTSWKTYFGRKSDGYFRVVFSDCFNETKAQNQESSLVPFEFMDIPNATKTLIELGGVPSAACLYQHPHTTCLVIPLAFYRYFPINVKAHELLDKFKSLMHKLMNGLDQALNSEETKKQRIKDHVTAAVVSYYTNGVENKEAQVAAALEYRDSLREQFVAAHNQYNLQSMELEGLKNSSSQLDDIKQRIVGGVEEIYKIKKIKKISYEPQSRSLVMETNFLYMHNPDTNVLHQLGEMTIKMNTVDFGLWFRNNTMKWHQYDHPHILKGNICYGNWGIGLPELLMEGRVAIFADQVVAFLETYHMKDDWGKNGIYWPVKDESEATPIWQSIKDSREKVLILNPVPEPEPVITDEELLDKVQSQGIDSQKAAKLTVEEGKPKKKASKNRKNLPKFTVNDSPAWLGEILREPTPPTPPQFRYAQTATTTNWAIVENAIAENSARIAAAATLNQAIPDPEPETDDGFTDLWDDEQPIEDTGTGE